MCIYKRHYLYFIFNIAVNKNTRIFFQVAYMYNFSGQIPVYNFFLWTDVGDLGVCIYFGRRRSNRRYCRRNILLEETRRQKVYNYLNRLKFIFV